jgi:hypothetical protein
MKSRYVHLFLLLSSCFFTGILQGQITSSDCDIDQNNFNSATGYKSKATGKHSFASGYRVKAIADNSFIFGTRATGATFDSINDISSNNTKNSFLILFQSKPVFFARLAPFSPSGELLEETSEEISNDTTQFFPMVGIGTSTPQANLDVRGVVRTEVLEIDNILMPNKKLTFNYKTTQSGFEYHEPDYEINLLSPPATDSTPQNAPSSGGTITHTPFSINGGIVNVGENLTAHLNVSGNTCIGGKVAIGKNNPRTNLDINGKVAIGNIGDYSEIADYHLAVAGNVIAEKVFVKLKTDWPDFVFNKNYKTKTIDEIESFINENGHLPDMPTAKEVNENGIEIGKMNAMLLQKIEELTLLVIEQNKTIKQLQEKIEN